MAATITMGSCFVDSSTTQRFLLRRYWSFLESTKDWVEPVDAERLVREGARFAIQLCLKPPVAGLPERFKRDVEARACSPFPPPKAIETGATSRPRG